MEIHLQEALYSVLMVVIIIISKFLTSYLKTQENSTIQKDLLEIIEKFAEMAVSEVERLSKDKEMSSEEKKKKAIELVMKYLKDSISNQKISSKAEKIVNSGNNSIVSAAVEKKVRETINFYN